MLPLRRISYPPHGLRSNTPGGASGWRLPAGLIKALIRLENALRKPVQELNV